MYGALSRRYPFVQTFVYMDRDDDYAPAYLKKNPRPAPVSRIIFPRGLVRRPRWPFPSASRPFHRRAHPRPAEFCHAALLARPVSARGVCLHRDRRPPGPPSPLDAGPEEQTRTPAHVPLARYEAPYSVIPSCIPSAARLSRRLPSEPWSPPPDRSRLAVVQTRRAKHCPAGDVLERAMHLGTVPRPPCPVHTCPCMYVGSQASVSALGTVPSLLQAGSAWHRAMAAAKMAKRGGRGAERERRPESERRSETKRPGCRYQRDRVLSMSGPRPEQRRPWSQRTILLVCTCRLIRLES